MFTRLVLRKVHTNGGAPGPDYFIPSSKSHLNIDEVYSFASMVAMFRSSWWPSGVLSENDAFATRLLTNDAVIRIGMSSDNTRQVADAASHSLAGPGVVWTSDDTVEAAWKYVLLANVGSSAIANASVTFTELGLASTASCEVIDLWQWKSLPRATGGTLSVFGGLRSHASLLLRLNCAADGDADDDAASHHPPL